VEEHSVEKENIYLCQANFSALCGQGQSRGLRNSTATKCTSPATTERRTRPVIAGADSGTRPDEDGEGAGILRVMTSFTLNGRGLARKAPTELIFKVLVKSRNSSP
jgi:hypothetical protein